MINIKVDLGENSYEIMIGHKNLPELGLRLKSLRLGDDAVIITNPVVQQLHGKALSMSLKKGGFTTKFLEVPDGEESKSAAQAFNLIEQVAGYNVKRKIFIVAFGGGVIGDLAGYVAAAYRRGVPYVQIPTTFLAQIDSAIGGKVAIDLPSGKNLVGAFYQPKLVFSDVALLSTLDQRQIRNGLAEVIKYGAICDRNFFDFVYNNADKLLALDAKALKEVVASCSRIKAKIVMNDEREIKGMRTILNFGHTIGHAIETANRYKDYQHGEAVALGMRVAAGISVRLGLIGPNSAEKINNLITAVGLPERIKYVSLSDILKYMEHDKKFTGKKNRFVLLTGIGSVKVMEGVDLKEIEAAIKDVM
ncbi:MAG: 3-dehydroquinate synthase [Candidatus Omnitrophota bacterium]|jgi:3-dehydroquinate synthase